MIRRRTLQECWRYLFYLCLALIAVLSVMPPQELTVGTGWDKANHALAFFGLLGLLDLAYPAACLMRRKIPVLLLYGVFVELLQSFYPDRFPSLLDVAADAVGLGCYAFVRPLLVSRLPWFYKNHLELKARQVVEK